MELVATVTVALVAILVSVGVTVWGVSLSGELHIQRMYRTAAELHIAELSDRVTHRMWQLERAVYLCRDDRVPGKLILEILLALGEDLVGKEDNIESAERSVVHRYRDNWLGREATQVIVDWARGVEKRSNLKSTGNSDLG